MFINPRYGWIANKKIMYSYLKWLGTQIPLTQISVVTCTLSYNILLWGLAQPIITV